MKIIKHVHLGVTTSTQDEAKRNVNKVITNDNEIVVYTADTQTSSRATHGRKWASPANVNLYATFAFRIRTANAAGKSFNLSQVVALSVAKVLQDFGLEPKLKWVNDVFVDGKKICGILCESSIMGNEFTFYIGVGLNINMPAELCITLDQPATSMLVAAGHSFDKDTVFDKLKDKLTENLSIFFAKDFGFFHPEIFALTAFRGEQILFDKKGKGNKKDYVKGILFGIDEKGQLVLQIEGAPQSFFQGRILKHSNKKLILVYNDSGTNDVCVKETIKSLHAALDTTKYEIKPVDKHFVNDEPWQEKTALFVMPGGRSAPFYVDLAGVGKGNEKISNFVKNGGKYLGICAGGYYGCQQTEFEIGYPLEIKLGGELNFYEGIACGPAYGPGQFSYESNEGVKAATITFHDHTGKELGLFTVYYNGGATFIPGRGKPQPDNIVVLANYAELKDSPPAIILCKVEKGLAILTGVHPEYSSNTLKNKTHPKTVIEKLKAAEPKRMKVFKALIANLGVIVQSESSSI